MGIGGGDTTSAVLPVDANGNQTSNVPESIVENGKQVQQLESVYLQDEWHPIRPFTLNYGLRFDRYSAYSSGSQVSMRINGVWEFDTRRSPRARTTTTSASNRSCSTRQGPLARAVPG